MFVSHAGSWDVRNEFLYASAEADGEASQTRPAAFIREEAIVSIARDRSTTNLAPAIQEHIEHLRQ